jgi:hypothetical protein
LCADHNLDHGDLLDPGIELRVIRALRVGFLTPLENQFHTLVHWGVKVTLEGQVQGIWTIIVIYRKLLNLFLVLIEDILPQLTFGVSQWNMLNLSIHGPVRLIVLHVQSFLPQDNFTIVRVVVLLGGIEVTEHKRECDIFLRYDFRG